MTVVVIGMHRSGTSLVAELLADLGVNMGASGGLWEDRRFVALNRRILAQAGGDWAHPPEHGAIVDAGCDYIDEIRTLAQTAAGGWKDPRNSLTLSCYVPFVPDLRLVAVRRRRVDVVVSLMRRHREGELGQWGPTRWAHLVDDYWARCDAAIERLDDVPAVTVDYEALVDVRRSAAEVERLGCVLEL